MVQFNTVISHSTNKEILQRSCVKRTIFTHKSLSDTLESTKVADKQNYEILKSYRKLIRVIYSNITNPFQILWHQISKKIQRYLQGKLVLYSKLRKKIIFFLFFPLNEMRVKSKGSIGNSMMK